MEFIIALIALVFGILALVSFIAGIVLLGILIYRAVKNRPARKTGVLSALLIVASLILIIIMFALAFLLTGEETNSPVANVTTEQSETLKTT
ncbi:hypothetical protein [Lacicoccus alkaliphilus]|uniref:Uncharacterized protein n=1 Tax=Lacicoccus alkaliphilus DSM 16010 TaxID=1123231 RepID=A0A1M7AAM5_9BACL|nr:hypothetical protein [Salinicoccus alkaliphilus]SHL39710.1 hypothetical protein SAMN02745189_00082 [Salinicoccus alkaliphilus DSM 16010]